MVHSSVQQSEYALQAAVRLLRMTTKTQTVQLSTCQSWLTLHLNRQYTYMYTDRPHTTMASMDTQNKCHLQTPHLTVMQPIPLGAHNNGQQPIPLGAHNNGQQPVPLGAHNNGQQPIPLGAHNNGQHAHATHTTGSTQQWPACTHRISATYKPHT